MKKLNTFCNSRLFVIRKFVICRAIFTGLVFIITVTIGYAQQSTEHYRNGKIKSTGMLKEGLKEGEWKFYFQSGQLMLVCNYFVEIRRDTIMVMDPVTLEETQEFVEEKYSFKHSKWTEYNERGQVIKETVYNKDEVISEVVK